MNTNLEKKRLFEEFPPVEKQSWEQTIKADLKGADYEKKLVWNTDDGLKVQPYYTAEDIETLKITDFLPAEFPYLRGTKSDNNWEVRQKIASKGIGAANAEAVDALKKGADAVTFKADQINSLADMAVILKDINLEQFPVHFVSAASNPQLLDYLLQYIEKHTIDKSKVRGSLNFDSFGYYLMRGTYWVSNDDNMIELAGLIEKSRKEIPGFKVLNIGAHNLHNAGATSVQELAFSLSAGAEYLAQMTDKNIPAKEVLKSTIFTYAIGSSYFMEIAKFRAARFLWAKIAEQFKPGCECCTKMYIHAVTSLYNKTIYDPYVNMLRTTTETMSAAIANVDSITVLPYDKPYSFGSNFSNRIARNQQVVLKEEAHLGKLVDPSAGSYYIEMLTMKLVEESWKLFLKIEEMGGFRKAMESGFVIDEIRKSAELKVKNAASRKTNILGTNQYPNMLENMLDKVEKHIKEDISLQRHRAAEIYEQIRLNTEKFVAAGNKKPVVFLMTFGNLAMRKARAGFATNFYACAGYEIIDNAGFTNTQEALEAAKNANASIIVFCSADEEYLPFTTEFMNLYKDENLGMRMIIAGYPTEQLEELKAIGIHDFIHVKTNIIDNLTLLQKELGI